MNLAGEPDYTRRYQLLTTRCTHALFAPIGKYTVMVFGRFQCPPSVDSLLKNRGTNVNYNSNVQVFTNKLNTNRETNRSRRRGTPDGAGALARDMVARRDVGGGGAHLWNSCCLLRRRARPARRTRTCARPRATTRAACCMSLTARGTSGRVARTAQTAAAGRRPPLRARIIPATRTPRARPFIHYTFFSLFLKLGVSSEYERERNTTQEKILE